MEALQPIDKINLKPHLNLYNFIIERGKRTENYINTRMPVGSFESENEYLLLPSDFNSFCFDCCESCH